MTHKTQELRFVLLRVPVFYPINLCNAQFIAFLCNYSVIRLSPVQFFMVNSVLHCILPLICQGLLPVCHRNAPEQRRYHFKAKGCKMQQVLLWVGVQ